MGFAPAAVLGAGPAPAPLPIAPLAPPAVPHVFTRCTPPGAEPEMDYLRVSDTCAVLRAFPNLGWVDVSAAFPGYVAAPALALQLVLGAPMHLDWGTAAADAALRQSETKKRRSPAERGAVISSAWMNTTPNFHQSSDAIASWLK
jgi:hypothetical protein